MLNVSFLKQAESRIGGTNAGTPLRDVFAELVGDNAPPAVSMWRNINAEVIRTATTTDKASYYAPDPGMLLSTSSWRATMYAMQWEHIRPVVYASLRCNGNNAAKLSTKEWREILGLPAALTRSTKADKARADLQAINASTGVPISEEDLVLTIEGKPQDLPPLPPAQMQRIIWELAEVNFRTDLMAMDHTFRQEYRPDLTTEEMHEMSHVLFENIFYADLEAIDVPLIFMIDPAFSRYGLNAPTALERDFYCEPLWRSMSEWPLVKPRDWLHPAIELQLNIDELESTHPGRLDQWQRVVALFYAQAYYDKFHRHAILPRMLPTNHVPEHHRPWPPVNQ